jgi:hypothetical protein
MGERGDDMGSAAEVIRILAVRSIGNAGAQ